MYAGDITFVSRGWTTLPECSIKVKNRINKLIFPENKLHSRRHNISVTGLP